MSKFSLALHMKAYLHHPYSIMLIGIGSWLGLYVVFMVTDHVPSYESIHPLSIFNHTYWYWVLAWVICCFYGDWPCTVIWEHTSIIHTQSHIMVLGLGLGHVLFFGVWPCTFIWQHTSIIHTHSHILVLGLGLGHMLLLWWLTMYPHMKAYIHHPQSIMHIGIGSWFG